MTQSIYNGKNMVPLQVDNRGFLANAGLAGGTALDIIVEGVQNLIVNSFSGLPTTVVLIIDKTVTNIEIVLNDGRVYRNSTKILHTAIGWDNAMKRGMEHPFYDQNTKDMLIKVLKNECENDMKKLIQQTSSNW